MKSSTSQDVAKKAGVSVATVSRVLNGSPLVTESVQHKVLHAVKELNYQPNRTAQRLRAGRSRVIGLIISDIQNPFFTSVVRGIEDVAYQDGYSLILCNSDEDPEKEKLYINVMRSEEVAGVILASASEAAPQVDDLITYNIPVVAVDRQIADKQIDSVLAANIEGAREAVAYLIKLGHRHIGFVGLPLTHTPGKERYEGYSLALREHNLKLSTDLVCIADAKQQGGYEHTRDLLANQPHITALFVANNLMTLGALNAIRERGLKIPDEISVIGFDDMPWASLLQPPLTAVAQPTYELGQRAAELLLGRLKERNKPAVLEHLPTQLIVRGSTGKPRPE
ncbi:MAG: LacI family DNA-binding transcriptional regulator [Chloroflexota bacterium]